MTQLERNCRFFSFAVFIFLLGQSTLAEDSAAARDNKSRATIAETLQVKAERDSLPVNNLFLKFADANKMPVKYSKVLKELCDTADVGVIHTFSYYKEIGQVKEIKESHEPAQIAKARKLLGGLGGIARKALDDELDHKERMAILEQLFRLEELVLKDRPLGTGNFIVANDISMLISALIFQEVAESDISDLDRLSRFTKRRVLDKHYTKQMFKDMLKREAKYETTIEAVSIYEFFINALKEKHPALVEEFKNRKIIDLCVKLTLDPPPSIQESRRSANPLVERRLESIIVDFLSVKRAEITARLSPIYEQLRRPYIKTKDREKFYSEFEKAIVRNTNSFERRIFSNTLTEQEIRKVAIEIVHEIADNLSQDGKNFLKFMARRSTFMSEGLGIYEE